MTKVLDPHDNITDLAIRYHHCVSQYASLGPVKILYAYNGISTCGVKHFLGLDVSLICRYGILKNMLGGDEVVVSIVNKISTCVVAPRDNFYYSQVFDDVSRQCFPFLLTSVIEVVEPMAKLLKAVRLSLSPPFSFLYDCSSFELRVGVFKVRFCKSFVNESRRTCRTLRNGGLGFMIG
ncbi:hypothetical protein TEA_019204 [Camellia sinensis var. sinensis]|uniref:Uncharacterized protein n=1 Tax=Camellia sinensis var. sinensis TaxID=542762 RepID=A0A4S4E950_CAMSN|nr:hypothetical protein TEA_019204 [Camellia sinensis var. sinensis]